MCLFVYVNVVNVGVCIRAGVRVCGCACVRACVHACVGVIFQYTNTVLRLRQTELSCSNSAYSAGHKCQLAGKNRLVARGSCCVN